MDSHVLGYSPFRKKDLATSFGNVTEEDKSEVQIVEHYSKYSNSVGALLKDVQLVVAGDAGVRAPLGDSVECGVMAWSAANNPEAHQRVEDWS